LALVTRKLFGDHLSVFASQMARAHTFISFAVNLSLAKNFVAGESEEWL